MKPLTDLGLYSITFTNDIDADHRLARGVQGFSRRRRRQRLLLFPRGLQSERRAGLERGGDARSSSTTRSSAVSPASPRRSGRNSSRSPTMGRERWKSWRRSTRAWWSACWAAEPAPRATASSSSIRPRNMARGSRCSGARSIWPNRRSTSCGSCAPSPTARMTPLEAVKDYHAALQKQGLKPIRETRGRQRDHRIRPQVGADR